VDQTSTTDVSAPKDLGFLQRPRWIVILALVAALGGGGGLASSFASGDSSAEIATIQRDIGEIKQSISLLNTRMELHNGEHQTTRALGDASRRSYEARIAALERRE
jgi:hypothetical protein